MFIRYFVILLLFFPVSAQAETIDLCSELGDINNYQDYKSYRMLIEGQDGWIFRTRTDFKHKFDMGDKLTEIRLGKLNQAFQDRGIKLVVAFVPTRGIMHVDKADQGNPDVAAYRRDDAIKDYKTFVQRMRDLGIAVAAIEDLSLGQEFFYKRDHHWNAEGARMMAREVAKVIKSLPEYQDIPKMTFRTQEDGDFDYPGSFDGIIKDMCGFVPPPQKIKKYKTFREETDDLFNDETKAEIAILGTSNSTILPSYANFAGALREEIGADVSNYAMSGSGLDSPMLSWFRSDEFKNDPPKIAILEIVSYFSYKNGPLYRSTIPAAYGDCDTAVQEAHFGSVNSEQIVFDELGSQNLNGPDYYVRLDFGKDFKKRKFKIKTEYENGQADTFYLRRHKKFKHEGLFHMSFHPEQSKVLKSVSVIFEEKPEAKLSAKICKFPETNN